MLKKPIYGFQRLRGASYFSQYVLLTGLSRLFPFGENPRLAPGPELIRKIEAETRALFKADAQNMSDGIYPVTVLKTEGPLEHLRRIPQLLIDGVRLHWRRTRKKVHDFGGKARDYAQDLPEYFTRNFHFQTDGYLSEKSAELYDHQVEMLFAGTANAMRRIFLRPMKAHFRNTQGQGLRILEIAAGTGSATRFLRLAFPKAKIIATDLSSPYLKVAQKRLADLDPIDFLQADAAHLPFKDQEFDAVVGVFLFHELPMEIRQQVLSEARRVLKPDGFLALVDSIQQGEIPEFDSLLHDFPVFYHEPFYKNYSIHPLEDLVQQAGFANVQKGRGYISKYVVATRPS